MTTLLIIYFTKKYPWGILLEIVLKQQKEFHNGKE
jgi:hypothetical protein